MNVQLAQEGGACQSGYRWHTVYGGCRRAALQQERQSDACGVDYTGEQTRVRERTQHFLQSTGQAANDAWGAWSDWDRSQCLAIPRRLAGTIKSIIDKVVGNEVPAYQAEFGKSPPGSLGPFRYSYLLVNGGKVYSSVYGVTLDRSTAQLQCAFASTTTSSGRGQSGSDIVKTWLLDLGVSIHTEHGYCSVSENNTVVKLHGDCNSSRHGDSGGCVGATRVVAVTAVTPCSATIAVHSFDTTPASIRQSEVSLCS